MHPGDVLARERDGVPGMVPQVGGQVEDAGLEGELLGQVPGAASPLGGQVVGLLEEDAFLRGQRAQGEGVAVLDALLPRHDGQSRVVTREGGRDTFATSRSSAANLAPLPASPSRAQERVGLGRRQGGGVVRHECSPRRRAPPPSPPAPRSGSPPQPLRPPAHRHGVTKRALGLQQPHPRLHGREPGESPRRVPLVHRDGLGSGLDQSEVQGGERLHEPQPVGGRPPPRPQLPDAACSRWW